MSSREEKRRVLQQLHDMGFQANEISVAIRENGYNLERCTDFLVSRQQNARPRLFVGMDVWIYSVDNDDWVRGNIVSITKQLVSIIFSGHDFRWLEKESDLFRIQDAKPPPMLKSHEIEPNSPHLPGPISPNNPNNPYAPDNPNNPYINPMPPKQDPSHNKLHNDRSNMNSMGPQPSNKPYPGHNNNNNNNNNNIRNQGNPGNQGNQGYQAPREDEIDYYVRFTESVLGLELYSDEDGFNCIVGRCVSNIARANVTPGSQIVQVNERWLANYRFEEIRDAVKQAAKSPPLNVTFRIKKHILNSVKSNPGYNSNVNLNQPNGSNNINNNNMQQGGQGPQQAMASYSNTTDSQARYLNPNGSEKRPAQRPADDALSGHSVSMTEEKEWKVKNPSKIDFGNEDDNFEPHMTIEQADRLQVGDYIDNRDDVGRFLLASIVEKSNTKVKIHYEGWNSKWDKWYDYTTELRKFARARSISRKPNTRFPQLKIRDYVDINPLERHPGWRPGQIRRMDKYSGQSQIVYKEDGQEFLYWAHLNNPDEIAPFMTKSAETIAKQQQQQQQAQQAQQQHQAQQQVQVQQPHQAYGNEMVYENGNNVNNVNNNLQDDRNDSNYNGSPNVNMEYSNSRSVNHNHNESMTFSNTSSRVRRALPATLQGKSLPPKPPRRSKP